MGPGTVRLVGSVLVVLGVACVLLVPAMLPAVPSSAGLFASGLSPFGLSPFGLFPECALAAGGFPDPDPAEPAQAWPDSLIEAVEDSSGFEVLLDLLASSLYRPRSAADSLRYLDSLRVAVRGARTNLEARRRLADQLASSPRVEARREAAQALTEALLVDDTDVDLWLRLARLRHRQRFTAYSRDAYQRALELAGDDPTVWDELAMLELLRFQRFQTWSYLDDAERVNAMVLALDPDYSRALHRLIRIACYHSDTARMDSVAGRWARVDPLDPEPRLVRGMLLTEEEDYTAAWRAYEEAFTRMDPSARREFEYLGVVDPPAEHSLRESPDSARSVADYWRWRDPTPSDDLNPRLLEHYRRMVLADLLFGVEDRGLRGWNHAPGALLVRLGVPSPWNYREIVSSETFRLSSTVAYEARAMLIRYGSAEADLSLRFVDFAMNGVYLRPPSTYSSADELLAQDGAFYESPYRDPERDQEIEIWKFIDETGAGRLEVALGLREKEWSPAVLREPERLLTRLAVYDSAWTRQRDLAADWSAFSRDDFGRLIGVWSIPAEGDSFVVGLETTDLDGTGRSAFYALVSHRDTPGSTPFLSDVALLRGVRFESDAGPYQRQDGAAMPNPGGVYRTGEPIGFYFEGYALTTDADGRHDASIRISVARRSRRGLVRVLLGSGKEGPRDMAFDSRAPGNRIEQLLGLEVPPLSTGDYVLQVEVEDRLGGRRVTAEASVKIIGAGDRLE